MTYDIVTWTTPYQQAERAFRLAGENMEFHRWGPARAALHEHARQLRELLAQIEREEMVEREREKDRLRDSLTGVTSILRGEPDHDRERLEQLRGVLRGGGEGAVCW